MKVFMDLEEHMAMKEKRNKKMKSKGKQNHGYEDDLELILNKQKNNKKNRDSKMKDNKKIKYQQEESFDEELDDFDYDNYKYR